MSMAMKFMITIIRMVIIVVMMMMIAKKKIMIKICKKN